MGTPARVACGVCQTVFAWTAEEQSLVVARMRPYRWKGLRAVGCALTCLLLGLVSCVTIWPLAPVFFLIVLVGYVCAQKHMALTNAAAVPLCGDCRGEA